MSGIACGVLMASGCGSPGMREKNKVVFLQGIYDIEMITKKGIQPIVEKIQRSGTV